MRAKADDQGVIGITNDDEVKTVCLNTAEVNTTICQVIDQGEFFTYKSGALQRKRESGSEDGSSLHYSLVQIEACNVPGHFLLSCE